MTALSAKIPLVSVADAIGNSSAAQVAAYDNDVILELRIRVRRLEKRVKILVGATIFLAAFVVMWAARYSPGNCSDPS